MIGALHVVGYGRPAHETLAAVIATAKRHGALAPVTVVVPSNFAGLATRRCLAGGSTGRGVANVQFVTPFRLAELLSGDRPSEGRPLTNPLLGAAIRRALSEQPGSLSAVADHEATELAFARLYAEVSHMSAEGRAAVAAAGGLPAAGVTICERVRAFLGDAVGEDEVADAVVARADLADVVRPLGHVVWHLPERVTPAIGRMLRAILSLAPSTVVVGLTGVGAADRPVLAACAQVAVTVDEGAQEVAPPVGSHIVSVSDCDEEVRAVVRRIARLAEEGIGLERIGVFYPSAEPYLLTLAAQLAECGIPANGPSGQRLADRIAGRTLLAALALPAARWRRDRVMALVAGAPVRDGDRRVRPSAWDEVSRAAGVVRDLPEWSERLSRHGDALHRTAARLDRETDDRQVARLEREAADCEALMTFVEDVAALLEEIVSADGWAAKTEAAQRLLVRLLGEPHRRSSWPDTEVDAASRVDDALSRLSSLDEFEPQPSAEVFARALAAELNEARGRVGRFGHGVVYGPLSGAVGLDFDAVFVLGMAEGSCPSPRREDALLPDDVRRLAAHELVIQADRIHDQHRAYLAALASAPAERRYLTFPRGDLRRGRARLPSRWLLDTATALAGRAVHSTDFAELGPPVVDVVASYSAGVRNGPTSASSTDHDLASLTQWTAEGGDARLHPAAMPVLSGMEALVARRSDDFTIWDGNLAGHEVPSPADGKPLSSTALERWAACGFRYYMGSVLRISERDEPEHVVELDAASRGSAIHEILERYFAEVIARGAPDPDTPWSTAEHDRLQHLAEAVFADLEAAGKTGRPLRWRVERERLLLLLERFLISDDHYRARSRTRPERVEMAFGMDGAAPAVIALGGGRELLLRGRADRVDIAEDGRRQVIDYKTGKGRDYKDLDQGDPVRGGTTLQLGVYSEAVVQALGAPSVDAAYLMVNEDVGFRQEGYPWNVGRRERFVEVVTAIVEGIEGGVFPAVPGEWDSFHGVDANCRFCSYDPVCSRDRGSFAEAKVEAPELRGRSVLTDYEQGG